MHRPALSMKCNGDAKCLVTAIENQAGEQPKPNPKQLIRNPSTARKDAQCAYFSFALESYICYECRSYCENTYLWELGIHGRMARSSWMRCIHLEASWVLIYWELHKMETGNEGLVCILFFCWTTIRQSQNRYITSEWVLGVPMLRMNTLWEILDRMLTLPAKHQRFLPSILMKIFSKEISKCFQTFRFPF